MTPYVSALLLAGGQGSRFKNQTPKQFCLLENKCIAHYSLELLLACPYIQEVVIVCEEGYKNYFQSFTHPHIRFAPPGATRMESVYQGALRACIQTDFFCIHDSARPLLTKDLLETILEEGFDHQAVALGVKVKNTIKQVSGENFVIQTLDRDALYEIQTPQVLASSVYWKGRDKAIELNLSVTDDIALAELIGIPAKIIPSDYSNLKITTPEDLDLAATLLKRQYAQI